MVGNTFWFHFGIRPIFRGKLAVSFRECTTLTILLLCFGCFSPCVFFSPFHDLHGLHLHCGLGFGMPLPWEVFLLAPFWPWRWQGWSVSFTKKNTGGGAWRLMIYTKKNGEKVVLEIDVHNLFINLFILYILICVFFWGDWLRLFQTYIFFPEVSGISKDWNAMSCVGGMYSTRASHLRSWRETQQGSNPTHLPTCPPCPT